LIEQNPRGVRLDQQDATDPNMPALDELREVRPGVCPECKFAARASRHFCPQCGTFIEDRWVGRLASPSRRLVAFVLDGTFKDGSIIATAFWSAIMPGAGARIIAITSGIYAIAALYLWTKGTTPAKRLLGMTVVTGDGKPAGFFRMAFRETIGKVISMAVLGLGLVSAVFEPENRGWHDRMFGTWVVRENED